jgi:hypothetical protein
MGWFWWGLGKSGPRSCVAREALRYVKVSMIWLSSSYCKSLYPSHISKYRVFRPAGRDVTRDIAAALADVVHLRSVQCR